MNKENHFKLNLSSFGKGGGQRPEDLKVILEELN
jgi:hypothetical protein